MQGHRPALGHPDQLGDVDLGDVDLGALQQRAGFLAGPWPGRRRRAPRPAPRRAGARTAAAARLGRRSRTVTLGGGTRSATRPPPGSPSSGAGGRRRGRARPAASLADRAAPSCGSRVSVADGPGDPSADSGGWATASTSCSATAMLRRSTAGSLWRWSMVSHPNGRGSCSAHCVRTVVLPYPGGAMIAATGVPLVASRCSTSPTRGTAGRAAVGWRCQHLIAHPTVRGPRPWEPRAASAASPAWDELGESASSGRKAVSLVSRASGPTTSV